MKIDDIAHVMHAARALGLTAYQYDQCRKIAAAARRNGVALCNLPDYAETFMHRKAQLHKRLEKLLAGPNVPPYAYELGGDPRGSCLKIALVSDALRSHDLEAAASCVRF